MNNVLHITEELSQKNYSISSLIFFLSSYIEKKIKIKHTILTTSLQSEIFGNSQDVKIIKLTQISNFFKINEIMSRVIKDTDIVHVHGLWRWINFISIVHCIINRKVFYLHPHGMLLEAALKNKGYLNYISKKFFIIFYQFFFKNKMTFISITKKETLSIKNYFEKSNIKFIPNPIPFNFKKKQEKKLNKVFVFFGRLHPIKNLELMIQSFKMSNLGNEWKLHIYGIEDDQKYSTKLKKLIKYNENIEIKEPIFGNEKEAVLRSSWANILLSKSEVLSLSVLESASLELPSIVNEEIQIEDFSTNEGVSVKPFEIKVSKKIVEISNWSLYQRKDKGKKLKEFIEKNFSIKVIGKKYFELYKKYKDDGQSKKFNLIFFISYYVKKYSILNTSLSYIFNLMIPTFLMVLLVVAGYSTLGAEIALINGFWLTITQIFSNNVRPQAIAKNSIKILHDSFSFRFLLVIISAIVIFFTQITNTLTQSGNNFYILELVSIMILLQWVFELFIATYEIKKKMLNIFFFNIFNLLFILSLVFGIFFASLSTITFFLGFHLLILIILILANIKSIFNIKVISVLKLILNNLRSVAFFSSFSIITSSFIWRYLIFSFYPKEISAIFFACFSIGSFPATVFNSSIGPSYVKQKTELNTNIKSFIIFLMFLIIGSTIISSININLDDNFLSFMNSLMLHTLSFSLLGSFLMTYAMFLRQRNIQYGSKVKTFWFDTIYGSLITILLPILYFYGSIFYVSLTFFFASVISLIIYGILLKFISYVPPNKK
ncbi:glycosyltransferase [Candidatus Pelagibacter sp.]|nr:glycosyltransferase [Candidatus Pelagibacter sp.]